LGGPSIAKCREARLDNFGIGGRADAFGGQAPMGPVGRLVGGVSSTISRSGSVAD
jgi:hypothetical protein